MNQYIAIIITNAVQLLVRALKFVPNLSESDFNEAIAQAKLQLDNATTVFAEEQTQTTAQVVEGMIHNGLEITQAALDAAGKTQNDKYFTLAKQFLENAGDGQHWMAAAVKTWFNKYILHKS